MKVKEILSKTYGENHQIVERALRLEMRTIGGVVCKVPGYVDIYRDLSNAMNIQNFMNLDYIRPLATIGTRKIFKYSTSSVCVLLARNDARTKIGGCANNKKE